MYFRGPGLSGLSSTSITFARNIIQGNASNIGGGVYSSGYYGNTITFVNNSIQGNRATNGSGGGLSLWLYATSDSANLYNNVFWGNTATSSQGADLRIGNDGDGDYFPSPVTLLHNNFDQTPGSGIYFQRPIPIDPSNLDKVDPLFVDADNGDLRLLPGSPMIDAGYPGTPDLPEFDIKGTPACSANPSTSVPTNSTTAAIPEASCS